MDKERNNIIIKIAMLAFALAVFLLLDVWAVVDGIPLFTGKVPHVVLEDYTDEDTPSGYAYFSVNACLGKTYMRRRSPSGKGGNGELEKKDYYVLVLNDGSLMAAGFTDSTNLTKLNKLMDNTVITKDGQIKSLSDEPVEFLGYISWLDLDVYTLFKDSMDLKGVGVSSIRRTYATIYGDPAGKQRFRLFVLTAAWIVFLIWLISSIRELKDYDIESGRAAFSESGRGSRKRLVVSKKHALERVTSEDIKRRVTGKGPSWKGWLLYLILWLIPIFVYYMNHQFVAFGNWAVIYQLDNPEQMESARKNRIGEITIDDGPFLAGIDDDNNAECVVLSNGIPYVAEIPSKKLDYIREEIEKNGSFTIHGYLDTYPRQPRKRLVQEYNRILGGQWYSTEDYYDLFGKYIVRYEPAYAGGRIVGRTAEIVVIVLFPMFIVLYTIVLIGDFLGRRKSIRTLQRMTDEEYYELEKKEPKDQAAEFIRLRNGK